VALPSPGAPVTLGTRAMIDPGLPMLLVVPGGAVEA